MSYRIEEIGACTKKFLFHLDGIDLSEKIDASLKEMQKKSNLKGFRKGKAPLLLIQRVYGQQIEADVLYPFISDQFTEAIHKEGIQAIGAPRFINPKYDKDRAISFEATIEYLPEIKLNDLSHLSFTKGKTTVSDEDVKKVRDAELEKHTKMVESQDDVLAKGHTAVINFQGERENGERPKDMKGEEFLLEIGSGSFIPGFEDALVGMKAEEKKEVPLAFPSDYHAEDLRNAKVKFEVELLEIKEKKRPELTDELAQELDYESQEDMEIKIRKRLEYQKEKEGSEKLNKEILDKLIKENQFEIPQTLIDDQEKAIQGHLFETLKQQKLSEFETKRYFDKWAGDMREKAIFQIRSGLILKKLAHDYSTEVSEQDMSDRYDEMAKQSGLTRKEIEAHYKKEEDAIKNLRYTIQEEKTFQKIYEKVQIVS